MKRVFGLFLLVLLVTALAACSYFRKENPLNIKCPSCGYIWDRTPTQEQAPTQQ